MLASVQGHILKHLLFNLPKESNKHIMNPSESKQKEALSLALTDILWNVKSQNKVVITLP